MANLEDLVGDVRETVLALTEHIKADKKVDDSELNAINELLEWIENQFIELLNAHGLELGDERYD